MLGLLEMQCQGAVGPRVVELVAAVAAEEDFDAEPLRRLGEAPGLIAELAREDQQALRIDLRFP